MQTVFWTFRPALANGRPKCSSQPGRNATPALLHSGAAETTDRPAAPASRPVRSLSTLSGCPAPSVQPERQEADQQDEYGVGFHPGTSPRYPGTAWVWCALI